MQALKWLMGSLAVALVAAEHGFIMPGVEVHPSRSRRQEMRVIFPDSPFFIPPRPMSGPSRAVPRPPRPLPEHSVPAGPESLQPDTVHGADEVLELPEDMDLNALDLDSLTRLNSIGNITDFADLFGISLPVTEEEENTGFEIVSRFGGIPDEELKLADMALCKPEPQVVPLDLPTEVNTVYYPTCVRLDRCGGCCYGPLLTCRPTVTKAVRFKVLKTIVGRSARAAPSDRRNRRRRRRRRESSASYHVVEEVKHVQCECLCKVQEEDCNPAIQTYLQGECACICKSKDEQAKCEKQNETKYWDNDSCACYCRRPVDCSTGEFFSQTSCQCEALSARGGFLEGTAP